MNRSRRLIVTAAAVSVLGIGFAFSTRLTGTARALPSDRFRPKHSPFPRTVPW